MIYFSFRDFMTLFIMIDDKAMYVKSNVVFKHHFELECPSIAAIWISVQTFNTRQEIDLLFITLQIRLGF